MSYFCSNDEPTLIQRVRAVSPGDQLDTVTDVLVTREGVFVSPSSVPEGVRRIDGSGLWAVPGLTDLQVHFREPGFEHKETIASGSRAALAGGITAVVVMPNTRPTLDTPEAVAFQSSRAQEVCGVDIFVAAAATKNIAGDELTDYAALKAAGAVAVTDDGFPLAGNAVMLESLRQCVAHDLLFMQHAEDPTLSQHGVMTSGPVSERLGVRGQHADAEGVMVERDVALALETGARYHVLHMSTARSLAAIRDARAKGGRVTCETSPHHLLLTFDVCRDADPNTKMNPPLRAESDRQAMWDGIVDGTIDALATDHAPHAADEKGKGFVDAPFGVVGLETAFAAALKMFHAGAISRTRAVDLMTTGPARVLQKPELGTFAAGNLALVDPDLEWTVGPEDLFGAQQNSAFLGYAFKGRVVATFHHGVLRYMRLEAPAP